METRIKQRKGAKKGEKGSIPGIKSTPALPMVKKGQSGDCMNGEKRVKSD